MTYTDRVFLGSCENMAEIPDGVVHTCVTSPPYFRLRDYGIEGQIGLEATLSEYVARLVAVFREVRRVLRDDGTLWLNLGDSYAGSWGAQSREKPVEGISANQIEAHPKQTQTGKIREIGLKPKDLMLVPHRVALALQADGWWVRNDAVWHKPNPMPSSVPDKLTNAHEYVFLLAKSRRYYYDADAIREPLAESSLKRINQATFDQQTGGPKDYANGVNPNNSMRRTLENFATKIKFGGNKAEGYGNETYSGRTWEPGKRRTQRGEQGQQVHPEGVVHDLGDPFIGANKRDVWTIATESYGKDHFAVMPREIAKTCILAGAPAGGLVLDPFMGSGTVAEVAIGCGRHYVGYELNPDYHELIRERLGLFGAA